jgi:oxygen-dependent protoporphyrinogen oxidase
MPTDRSVAVIGGGLTGLAAAVTLRRAGVPVMLYEGGSRAGGVIRSVAREGYLVECGPQVLSESHPDVTDLIDWAGLRPACRVASREARQRFIVRGARLVPVPASPLGAVTTPLLSPSAKLRVLAEPWLGQRADGTAEESIADFVARRFGPGVRDVLAEAYASGVWAGSADTLAVRFAMPAAWRLEREHGSVLRGLLAERRASAGRPRPPRRLVSFDGGLESLPRALAAGLGPALKCEAPVTGLHRTDLGWRVTFDHASGLSPRVHRAVVYAGSAPRFPEVTIDEQRVAGLGALATMPHTSVAVVGLGFHQGQLGSRLTGWGALVSAAERSSLLGVVFSSAVFPRRAPAGHVLVTALLGGARDQRTGALPSADLVGMAVGALTPLLRLTGEPAFQHVSMLHLTMPQYDLQHGHRLAVVDELERNADGLVLAGCWRRGTGLPTAIREGVAAARRIQGAF